MAPNKFATKLNKITNKITLVLVYAILEWVLIFLLLLNSLFSYLIIKFSDYFGLKRPCLWCSRIDHLFHPKDSYFSYRSLVCEAHATEISKLGYCLTHKKLSESQAMCLDCSASLQRNELFSGKFTFYPWMKQLGAAQDCKDCDKVSENCEVGLKCSCCGGNLGKRLNFLDGDMVNGFWGDFDQTQKGSLGLEGEGSDIVEKVDDFVGNTIVFPSDKIEEVNEAEEKNKVEIEKREEEAEGNKDLDLASGFMEIVDDNGNGGDAVVGEEREPLRKDDFNVIVDCRSSGQNVMVENGCEAQQHQHLEFFIDQDDCHLIPVELMECRVQENQVSIECGKVEEEDFVMEFVKDVRTEYELLMEEVGNLEEEEPLLSVYKIEVQPEVVESRSRVHLDEEFTDEEIKQVAISESTETCDIDGNDKQESWGLAGEPMKAHYQAFEELLQMQSEDCEVDVSLGTDIPEQEANEDMQVEEVPHLHSCLPEEPSTSNSEFGAYCDHGFEQVEECPIEFKAVAVEANELSIGNHLPVIFETNKIEEDAVPDTPTSMDSLHIHKKLLMLERKESGTEDSLDGSVLSDIDAGDGTLTMEKLKSALRAERKALNALYAELEEERSASAVAASQTMAMINRLQEEKAAMQMEALQYQRMMDEQSEYDQEALQLLNDLMVKREKEKEEVEKELQVYRKRVQDYEMKEKMMGMKRRKDGSQKSGCSSASCSNSEDGDGPSIDLNHEKKDEDSFLNDNHGISNQNTPVDAVLCLEESLANFEEERLSILEQLKVLEEKLIMLSDEDEQHFKDIRPIDHFYTENGNGYHEDLDHSCEANGVLNGHYKETNGYHYKARTFDGAKAKRLLPLFDAIDIEAEDGGLNGHVESCDEEINGNANGFNSVGMQKVVHTHDSDDRKLTIEEEVDHVYERLQAFEADREFLRHCITSLRKGDKGIELLREILQHLRDLRCVELRVKA